MQRVAGAKAIPCARRADGAPMPHATRGGWGTVRPRRQISRSRQRGVRGCRGCRGDFPLSPHAPRRAGDPPSAPGSSRDAQRGSGLIRPRAFYLFQRRNTRRRHSAARPKVSGKSAVFLRNDRPYGLKRTAFQTENASACADMSRSKRARPSLRKAGPVIFFWVLGKTGDFGGSCGNAFPSQRLGPLAPGRAALCRHLHPFETARWGKDGGPSPRKNEVASATAVVAACPRAGFLP